MLSRDFNAPKKEYINKNKTILIVLGVFILVGIIMMSILGFNRSPEFEGGYVADVKIGQEVSSSQLDKYENKINSILNENNMSLYSVQLKGVGEATTVEIKYTGKLTDSKINAINSSIITDLNLEAQEIEHLKFDASVKSADYIYTVVAGLIIVLIATLFVIFRHNIAYAISLLGASAFSVLAIMSIFAILRLQITSAFFFIVVGCLIYTIYESLTLFEKMREVASVPENKNDKSLHLVQGMKNNTTRLQYTSLALFFFGFLFVIFGTPISRSVALGFMFAIVVTLLTISLVLPFLYNITIDKVSLKTGKKSSKEKAENKEIKADKKLENKETQNTEEVVEERYTQEPVDVEVVDNKADTTNS